MSKVNPRQVIFSEFFGVISLDFLVTGESHSCPYMPGRIAREEVFRDSTFPPELYHDFMNCGFRRAGFIFYRPLCRGCADCMPLRIPARQFKPSKSQRRVMRKNQDVSVKARKPRFTPEKAKIYAGYIEVQHDSTSPSSPEDLKRFLYSSPVDTIEFEYYVKDRLAGVGIVDRCSRSLSSVYMYYDPEFSNRSLGTYSAIREIQFCRDRSIPYYHMGFWIPGCPSMSYKSRFRPHEILGADGRWVPGSMIDRSHKEIRETR
ncbi:arginyltransferase [Thermodesulfobacteriota bacterium]